MYLCCVIRGLNQRQMDRVRRPHSLQSTLAWSRVRRTTMGGCELSYDNSQSLMTQIADSCYLMIVGSFLQSLSSSTLSLAKLGQFSLVSSPCNLVYQRPKCAARFYGLRCPGGIGIGVTITPGLCSGHVSALLQKTHIDDVSCDVR
jgi:hypothetical protein